LANWLKKNIQQSFVYKRPTSLTEKNTDLRWKAGRSFTKTMVSENNQE
jgi:hypothetical protein